MRLVTLLVVLWHFAALPALCPSGVLAHLCPGDASAACTHEDDCSSDPCSLSDDSAAKGSTRSDERWSPQPALIACDLHEMGSVAVLQTVVPSDAEPDPGTLRRFPLRN